MDWTNGDRHPGRLPVRPGSDSAPSGISSGGRRPLGRANLRRVMNRQAARRGLGTRPVVMAVVLLGSLLARGALAQQQVGNYASRAVAGRSVVVTGASGEKLRITPYGDYIVRIQVAKNGESFYADDRYHMVESHDWTGALTVVESTSSLTLTTAAADGVSISLAKQPM